MKTPFFQFWVTGFEPATSRPPVASKTTKIAKKARKTAIPYYTLCLANPIFNPISIYRTIP